MSQFNKFAKRFHKVKVGLQDMAMQELAKVTSVYEKEVAALQGILLTLEAAKAKLNEPGITGLDFASWETYIKRLEIESQYQHAKVASLDGVVREKRENVKTAYIEQKKWSVILENSQEKMLEALRQKEQLEADDSAAIRHGRSV